MTRFCANGQIMRNGREGYGVSILWPREDQHGLFVVQVAGRRGAAEQRRKRDGFGEDGRQARPRHAAAERAAPPGKLLSLARGASSHPQHRVLCNLSVLRHRGVVFPR